MARRRGSGRRRRGRFQFFWKFLVTLSICAVVVLALTLFFRVDAVTVTGNVRYTAQQVREASGVESGDNLFLLNKYEIAGRILEKLPYAEEVRINRRLPDTLLINVTECVHTAAVAQGGTTWLISPGGKIVEAVKGVPAGDQCVLDGIELLSPSVGTDIVLDTGEESRQESLLALLDALERAGLTEKASAIHLGEEAALTMEYADRFTVVMPWGADYVRQLKYLTAVEDSLETNQTGTIDLTRDGEPHFRPD